VIPRLRGSLFVASGACLWGLWSLFVRPTALPPLTSAALTMSVLAVGGIYWQWKYRRRERPFSAWLWMALFGVVDVGNIAFFFSALRRGPVAVATLTHYLAPTLTPLFAKWILGERLSPRTYPAVLLGLGGLFLLLQPGRSGAGSLVLLETAALGGASALFYGAMVPLGRKLSAHFSPFEVQGYHAYVTAGLLWIMAPRASAPVSAWLLLVAGAILCGLLAGGLFYAGIREIRSAQASVLTYLEPLVGSLVGALAFGEPLGPTSVLGASLVVTGGAYLATERVPEERAAITAAPVASPPHA
jgi:drug/metabolite transporter (DMT)-like permease